jgi:hypothetical protein
VNELEKGNNLSRNNDRQFIFLDAIRIPPNPKNILYGYIIFMALAVSGALYYAIIFLFAAAIFWLARIGFQIVRRIWIRNTTI